MLIDLKAAGRWRHRLGWAASAVLMAGGLLLPVSSSAVAQPVECPTSPIGAHAPSQVSTTDRATILQLHNQYRREVGMPPLAWDDSLADAAQGWAGITVPLGKLCHDPNRPNQGENLADHRSVTDGVKLWYAEKSKYDSNPGPVNLQTGNWRPWGHYSQMVWSSTQRVGCGQAASRQYPGNIVLDCRYSPPGNIDGQTPYPPHGSPPKDTPPKDTPPKDTPPKDTPPKDTSPADTAAQVHGRRFYPPPEWSNCKWDRDVTADFNAWLAKVVPDDSEIYLRKNGCYLSNGTISFQNRFNIRIFGEGATIKASTDAPAANRARLEFDLGGGFVVRDVVLQGTNFTADCAVYGQRTCFNLAVEKNFWRDRGVFILGSDGVLLDNVQILNSWGDGLEVTAHRYLPLDNPPPVNARNVTVQNSRVETTGRNGFSCPGCHITVQNNTLTNIGNHVVNVEREFPGGTGDVKMIGNRVSNIAIAMLNVSWVGPDLGLIVVRDNVMADPNVSCLPPIDFNSGSRGANPASVTIANNSLHSYNYGMRINDVSHADVTGNTVRIDTQNGCVNEKIPGHIPTVGVQFDNVSSGSITRNTLINAHPLVRPVSSTATVCGNRATTTGAFDQPVPCANTLPTPTIVTTATPTAGPRGRISDTATFSGLAGSGPFGTVTFSAFLNDRGCETSPVLTSAPMTVPGNGTSLGSGKLTSTPSGSYTWKVDYSGNPGNNPVSQCGGSGETSVVGTLATPTISTQASAGGPVGTWVHDTATLTGGTRLTGTVTFVLFSDAACTSQVFTSTEPLADGTASSALFRSAAPGTYFWRAFYNGDANNNAISGACGASKESVAIA